MKLANKIIAALLVSLVCFVLTACGGGGGGDDTGTGDPGPQITEAVVTFSLSGGPATDIGSVQLDIDLPLGFILAAAVDGTPAAGVVTADSRLTGDVMIAANYIPEADPDLGQLRTGLISTGGFPQGVLFRVIKTLATDESLPDQADFVEVLLEVYDASDDALPLAGYTVDVIVQLRPSTL